VKVVARPRLVLKNCRRFTEIDFGLSLLLSIYSRRWVFGVGSICFPSWGLPPHCLISLYMGQNVMRILVLGANGMLGHAMVRVLNDSPFGWQVFGTVRAEGAKALFRENLAANLIAGVDVLNNDSLNRAFSSVSPNVVINCVGLIKQLPEASDPLSAIPVNALFPHRLARLCMAADARLIHMSTDCVFSGRKGLYTEADAPDARDLYGLSKYLGEVDYAHAVTLRTSIIGKELCGEHSLVSWFLSRQSSVKGFTRAVFSGLPTVEISEIVANYVIPKPDLRGVYHVSAAPINKFDLLCLVAREYSKNIEIEPDDTVVIDRSLDSSRFTRVTGYQAPPWPVLVRRMREFE
jgi:dTDP-4-dehydrorhamnose reductase